MSVYRYSKIGNTNPSETITKKLKFADYVFCYKDIELTNAVFKYWFDEIEHTDVEYVDGKKISSEKSSCPTIDLYIKAEDENQKEYSFAFMLDMDLKALNKMPTKPTKINHHLVVGEVFFNIYDEGTELLDFDEEENIYHYNPSIWVAKLEENIFIFKVQYQNLFIWFKADFN